MAASAGAAAAAAAIANAIKASGVLVRVKPEEFTKILALAKEPLIVVAEGGLFKPKYQYLMSFKGLAFVTRTDTAFTIPQDAQLITANRILIPG